MKNLFFLSMAMVLVLCACETDPEVKLNEQAVVDRTLLEIDKNHEILVAAYQALTETAHKEAILTCRKSGGDQAEFVAKMFEKSNEAFEKAVTQKHGEAAADYFLKIPDIEGESLEEKKALLLQENSVEAYRAAVLERLKKKSADTERWYIMKNLVLDNESHSVPMEEFSLNYEEIKSATKLADILLDLKLSDTERTQALNDALNIAQLPPVPVALLLPAIQKVREAANATKAEELYLEWLETEVIPTTSGGLDRDIIRRKAFFEYLGGLDLVISQGFNHDDQVEASIAIMKVRYDLKMLCLWTAYWDMELAE
ncbi:MAG: hypothetical protein KF803_03800 [Cyclobacteriaceae bacterium]|nr:hypothetical protein [Cyclobacteriaceae bacterium]